MTVNDDTSEAYFTHYESRATYASLHSNFDYLFTYKNQKNLNISNTNKHVYAGVFHH